MTKAEDATPLERSMMALLAHRPGVAKAFARLFGAIKQEHTLPARLLELVRLRLAFHNQCRSCMAIRYSDSIEDGLTEDLVCSLEKPMEASNLTEAEKAAVAFADKFANNHLAIDDSVYDGLRVHFTEGELVELGAWCATMLGFGRLAATWHMTENLPSDFQQISDKPITPWQAAPVVIR